MMTWSSLKAESDRPSIMVFLRRASPTMLGVGLRCIVTSLPPTRVIQRTRHDVLRECPARCVTPRSVQGHRLEVRLGNFFHLVIVADVKGRVVVRRLECDRDLAVQAQRMHESRRCGSKHAAVLAK